MSWDAFLSHMPLMAILRGVTPDEATPIGAALLDAGIICVEVPLNSPEPLRSIAALRETFDGRMLVGAGTVLSTTDVDNIHTAGAQFIVSPNTDAGVITAARGKGLHTAPGFFTATEAFAAIAAGADALKLFPADNGGPAYVKALKAVLPAHPPLLAVGGASETSFASFLDAGALGFGLGSSLYKASATPEQVYARAASLVRAYKDARA